MSDKHAHDPHPGPASLLQGYSTVLQLPVHWGEQDMNGHVNHAAPVRWLESARMAYLRHRGLDQLLRDSGLALIISSLDVSYLRQISYPDQVHVGVRLAELRRSTMRIRQAVVSEAQSAVAIEAEVRVAAFDPASQRPRRIPEAMAELMRRDVPEPQ